jgi:pimeloyl-ACP methyl ester carboxylesterase
MADGLQKGYWMRVLAGTLLLFMVGFAIGVLGARLVHAQSDVPSYEAGECPFDAPANIECGYVTVMQDRDDPDQGQVRLAVVIARGDETQAPVITLSGGPGEITTPSAGLIVPLFQGIVGGRTLIAFDQRGVGRSEPALACPEWTEMQISLLAPDTTPEQAVEGNYASLVACAERLRAEGIDLNDFDSVQNAADVADIARALGYEQVNLLGVSYGSLLAQHVLRDHPEIVRAAVIDSVLPLDVSFFVGTFDTAFDAVERLLAACAADGACGAAYPTLRDDMLNTIRQYNANPVPITLTHPITGEQIDSLLTGDIIVSTLIYFLYQTPAIPTLPERITAIAQGDTSAAEALASQFIIAYYAIERGMQYSVQCAEDLLMSNEAEYGARLEALIPEFRGRADVQTALAFSPFDICEAFDVEPLDLSVKQPLMTDVPVLALAGEFDPVTPPSYAERVTANLPNAFTYTFPGAGHSIALASTCAQGIIRAFLDDPTTEPDSACVGEMSLSFRVAGAALDLPLEPFTSAQFGVSGVIPAGWQEISPGVYAESMSGSVVIIQQAAPLPEAQLAGLLAGQFGIDAFPEAASVREANGLTWSLYETPGPQGLLADVALANRAGMTYVIVLLSGASDRAAYYDALFIPAVDALTAN